MLAVRNCWYVAAWRNDVSGDILLGVTILEEPILLYRTASGRIAALEDRCVHRLAPLSLGEREGDTVRCLYHGLRFDSTGVCVEIPGQAAIPRTACVRAYPVTEAGDWIWVWMGDPDKADLSVLPMAVGAGAPGWVSGQGQLDYEANYQLINDNLTDFSHLAYVHRRSFGATTFFTETRAQVSRIDRGIRVQRWMRSGATQIMATERSEERFQTYDYLVPGILLMSTVTYAEGAALASGNGPPSPNLPKIIEVFSAQALTPIGEQRTRYFFANSVSDAPGNKRALEGLMAMTVAAFAEDKAMIEGQQRIINTDPERQELLFGHDSGPVQMRRVIAELAQAEIS